MASTSDYHLAFVASLPSPTIANLPPDNQECTICTEPYRSPSLLDKFSQPVSEQPAQLPCGHIFGRECIARWLKDGRSCPICRRQFFQPPMPSPASMRDIVAQLVNLAETFVNRLQTLAGQAPPPPPPRAPPRTPALRPALVHNPRRSERIRQVTQRAQDNDNNRTIDPIPPARRPIPSTSSGAAANPRHHPHMTRRRNAMPDVRIEWLAQQQHSSISREIEMIPTGNDWILAQSRRWGRPRAGSRVHSVRVEPRQGGPMTRARARRTRSGQIHPGL